MSCVVILSKNVIMMERIMVRTQIQLTEEQSRTLKSLAAQRGVPVAELIRQSVDRLLRSSIGLDEGERHRRAIAAAGKFRSGQSDVSINHDLYLTKAYAE
jgi:predicted DNA-binding protein